MNAKMDRIANLTALDIHAMKSPGADEYEQVRNDRDAWMARCFHAGWKAQLILIVFSVGYYYCRAMKWAGMIALPVMGMAAYSMVKREGFKEGYIYGYEYGLGEGVDKALGITEDESRAIFGDALEGKLNALQRALLRRK